MFYKEKQDKVVLDEATFLLATGSKQSSYKPAECMIACDHGRMLLLVVQQKVNLSSGLDLNARCLIPVIWGEPNLIITEHH